MKTTIETISLIELERLHLDSEHNPALSDLQRDAIQRAIKAEFERRDKEMRTEELRIDPSIAEEVIEKFLTALAKTRRRGRPSKR